MAPIESPPTPTGVPTIRKPYQKPQIEQVRLVAEEAVLGNCKGGAWSGPTGGGCQTSGIPCTLLGS